MSTRSRFTALAVGAALVGGLGLVPAGATHNEIDEHTRNLRHLAQEPIRIDKNTVAEGSDLAFQGRLVVAGSYQGTSVWRRTGKKGGYIKQVGFHRCPGGQGDVSVFRDFVFVSIDSNTSNNLETPQCNNTKSNRSDSSLEKEGLRIVDISSPRRIRQVGFVETDCGSHTHTLLPADGKLYAYISSYPLSGQGPSCNHATHRKFSIVELNLKRPAKSDVVATPALPPDTIGCHDFTVLPRRDLAIGACLGVWVTMDISDPTKPEILAETRNPELELDHSSAVTWDGKIAIIGDEHAGAVGGGGCSPDSSSPVGAMWFYDISDPENPVHLGNHSLPRIPPVDSPEEIERFRCTTHNFNVVPMRDPKKYIAVSSYYSGGIAVIDFSDPAEPKELAFYHHAPEGVNPDTWSAYWHNGRIYTNDFLSHTGVGVYQMRGLGKGSARFFGGRQNPQTQIPSFGK